MQAVDYALSQSLEYLITSVRSGSLAFASSSVSASVVSTQYVSASVFLSYVYGKEKQMLAGGYDEESPDLHIMARTSEVGSWGIEQNNVVLLDSASYSVWKPIDKTNIFWRIPLKERK